jgi:hypothetical protein
MAKRLIGGKAERYRERNEERRLAVKAERKQEAERRVEAALVKLGVDPAEVKPRIGLLSDVLNDAREGVAGVIRAMRMSGDPMIVAFLKQYDGVSEVDRKRLPIEAYAIAAKLDLTRLLGAIMLALREQSANKVKMIALTAHPHVTRASVKYALKENGVRDRQMVHQALGFLAPPQGQTINVNLPGFPGPEDGEKLIRAEDIDMNEVFPDLITTQRKLLGPEK